MKKTYLQALEEGLTKVCSSCGESHTVDCFHKIKLGKYGVGSRCKVCFRAYQQDRNRLATVRAKRNAWQRKWSKNNKAKATEITTRSRNKAKEGQ